MPESTRAPRPRPDASMVLLDEVMNRPLDAGYAEAAARKATSGPGRRPRGRAVALVVAVAALGFATATAASALRAPRGDVLTARTVLEQEIRARRASVDELTTQIAQVSGEIDALQSSALGEGQREILVTTANDAAAAGTLAVRGPGLHVELRDAVPLLGEESSATRVQDYDIQLVVNALWASGAQAIGVNGQRLTSTSAIRSAGEAILVDLVGLSGPYRIEAIGDPATLPAYFARSLGQQHLSLLSARYGITSSVGQDDKLELGAGRTPDLLRARSTIGSGGATPTTTSTP